MLVTLPSGKYLVSLSSVPEPGSDADPEYLSSQQIDCARNDVQRFLSFSERSSGQLRKKVLSLGYPGPVADTIVRWAIESGFVDDRRFCKLFISSRIMGRVRLRMELSRRRVPDAVIDQVLETVSEAESREELVKQIASRYGSIADYETARRRASGWLSRRGFSSETVHQVLKEAL
ncbi:MAG: regulatory protein RecX [Candidatus Fermentibacteria bacterium]|nr:regulatory protein RecX [Candidatus Fermentibacteria bacterium]